MTPLQRPAALIERALALAAIPIPHPASGQTPERHRRLLAIGREDLSVARLVEAHHDALAILAEASRTPHPGALYGVWAAESPQDAVTFKNNTLTGAKPFCSGAGIVDRALVTVKSPNGLLAEVDLRAHPAAVTIDHSAWVTSAFAETGTAHVSFDRLPLSHHAIVGPPDFYLNRPGFWHGACGPAACWAGGAAGLFDFALSQTRDDPHTLAHIAAMHADVWSMQAALEAAGREIDASRQTGAQPDISPEADDDHAKIRALTLRHIIEQACTDLLSHFHRAFGPHPLAMNAEISRRHDELQLYLRQSHAERDLETLTHSLRRVRASAA